MARRKKRTNSAGGAQTTSSVGDNFPREPLDEVLGGDFFPAAPGDGMVIDEGSPVSAGISTHPELIKGLPDDLVRQWILPKANPASYSHMKKVSRGWRALVEQGELFKLRQEQNHVTEMLCVTAEGQGWELYDPRNDSWTFLPWGAGPLTQIVKYRCVGVGSKLYILGGNVAGHLTKRVYAYDLATAKWSRVADMLTARQDFACCTDGKRIWVAGGSATYYSRDGEVYHPEDDTWVPLPEMANQYFGSTGNRRLQGLWIRDSFLVEPGHYCFNPTLNTWSSPAPPVTEADTPYMVADVGGELYGVRHAPGDDGRHVRIDWYDFDTAVPNGSVNKDFIRRRKVSALPSPNSCRYKFGMAGFKGRLYTFGGKMKAGPPGKRRRRKDVNTVEVYNPMPTLEAPEWCAVGSMRRAKGEVRTWTSVVA